MTASVPPRCGDRSDLGLGCARSGGTFLISDYQERRTHELRPLMDALTIHVRIQDARIVQTGGNVYNVEGSIGAWRVNADECGWSLTDADGASHSYGGWYYDSMQCLAIDPDTGALDPDECDAAAHGFSIVLSDIADVPMD